MKTRVGQLVRWLLVERDLDANLVSAWDRVQLLHAALAEAEAARDAELAEVEARHAPAIAHLERAAARAHDAYERIRAQSPGIDQQVRRAWKTALLHSSLRVDPGR